jgi:hypothetical protein
MDKGSEPRMRAQVVDPDAVFLNIPYDDRFRRLYLAYIVGLYHFGLKPRVTLGIPGGERRLERILGLIQSCRYSIHDLSRVEIDRSPPPTPRFNMPFELGLAVACSHLSASRHNWFLFETRPWRIQKSLSDLDGTDPHIHEGRVAGVMRELCNAFVRQQLRPTVPGMMQAYRQVSRQANALATNAGSRGIFESRAFEDLCLAAKFAADNFSG